MITVAFARGGLGPWACLEVQRPVPARAVRTRAPAAAQAELIYDQYGNAYSKDKVCPWADNEGRCPICPVPYVPCWEEGVFCYRPIYCQGKFSPV